MSLILSIKFCIKKFKPLQKGGGGSIACQTCNNNRWETKGIN